MTVYNNKCKLKNICTWQNSAGWTSWARPNITCKFGFCTWLVRFHCMCSFNVAHSQSSTFFVPAIRNDLVVLYRRLLTTTPNLAKTMQILSLLLATSWKVISPNAKSQKPGLVKTKWSHSNLVRRCAVFLAFKCRAQLERSNRSYNGRS